MAALVPFRQSRNLALDVRILRTVILSFANDNVDNDADRSSPHSLRPYERSEKIDDDDDDDARTAANMVNDVRTLAPSLGEVLTKAMARTVDAVADRGAKGTTAAAWAETFQSCIDSFPSEHVISTGGERE